MAKYSRGASKSVASAMRRRKKGSLKSGSGRSVKSRKQAIAIGLNEARRKGAKVPPPKSSAKGSRKGTARKSASGGARQSSSRKTASRQTASRKTASRKTASRKTASRKTASRKTASRKTASRKTSRTAGRKK